MFIPDLGTELESSSRSTNSVCIFLPKSFSKISEILTASGFIFEMTFSMLFSRIGPETADVP